MDARERLSLLWTLGASQRCGVAWTTSVGGGDAFPHLQGDNRGGSEGSGQGKGLILVLTHSLC